MPYASMLYVANINTLATRREDISKKFFRDITITPPPAYIIFYLIQESNPLLHG